MKLTDRQISAATDQIWYLIKDDYEKRIKEQQDKESTLYSTLLDSMPDLKAYLEHTNGRGRALNAYGVTLFLKKYKEELFNGIGVSVTPADLKASIQREVILHGGTAKTIDEVLNKVANKYIC
jgi:hypothetical protein